MCTILQRDFCWEPIPISPHVMLGVKRSITRTCKSAPSWLLGESHLNFGGIKRRVILNLVVLNIRPPWRKNTVEVGEVLTRLGSWEGRDMILVLRISRRVTCLDRQVQEINHVDQPHAGKGSRPEHVRPSRDSENGKSNWWAGLRELKANREAAATVWR